jgi:hypothetical protein
MADLRYSTGEVPMLGDSVRSLSGAWKHVLVVGNVTTGQEGRILVEIGAPRTPSDGDPAIAERPGA